MLVACPCGTARLLDDWRVWRGNGQLFPTSLSQAQLPSEGPAPQHTAMRKGFLLPARGDVLLRMALTQLH